MNCERELPSLPDEPCCGFTGSVLTHVYTNLRAPAATQTLSYYLRLAHLSRCPIMLAHFVCFPRDLASKGR